MNIIKQSIVFRFLLIYFYRTASRWAKDNTVCFLGVHLASEGSKTEKQQWLPVLSELSLKSSISAWCIQGHSGTFLQGPHLKLRSLSNFRCTSFSSLIATFRNTNTNVHRHTLKRMPTEHSGCCSLFIHSCGGLDVWLGTASFFSPLSPSLPFPEGLCQPQVHNSDCATQWFHSDQRHCFFEPRLSLLASPLETELLAANWILLLL